MVTTPLRERMRTLLRIRNFSSRTEEVYINAVARFAKHFGRSPEHLGAAEIEAYLLFLRDAKKVSWCWFNQTACALRFFYTYVLERPDLVLRIPYGRLEHRLPVVLSVEELLAFLAAILATAIRQQTLSWNRSAGHPAGRSRAPVAAHLQDSFNPLHPLVRGLPRAPASPREAVHAPTQPSRIVTFPTMARGFVQLNSFPHPESSHKHDRRRPSPTGAHHDSALLGCGKES